MPQTEKILKLLEDGQFHSTVEIMEKCYGSEHCGLARVSARVWDLKQKGHWIVGKRDPERKTVYWYKLIQNQAAELFA